MVCGWGGDLVLTAVGDEEAMGNIKRFMLMNILFLSETINYLVMHFGFSPVNIYEYQDKETGATFMLAETVNGDEDSIIESDSAKTFSSKKPYETVDKVTYSDLLFHQLVRIR